MCVCTWEGGMSCLGRQPRHSCHLQVCSTAKGLHHFQMRDGTEPRVLYKLMVCTVLHLWSWSLWVPSKIFYDSLKGLKYGRYHMFSNQQCKNYNSKKNRDVEKALLVWSGWTTMVWCHRPEWTNNYMLPSKFPSEALKWSSDVLVHRDSPQNCWKTWGF